MASLRTEAGMGILERKREKVRRANNKVGFEKGMIYYLPSLHGGG